MVNKLWSSVLICALLILGIAWPVFAAQPQVSAGAEHSLALKDDGTVWAWGNNSFGQLGNGSSTDRFNPGQVSNFSDVIAVEAGLSHSIAINNDSTVWAWGNNSNGQLGDGTTTNSTLPVQVPGLSNIIGVAAGNLHTVALKADGTVWTWGGNSYGQLGDGTSSDYSSPIQVSGLTNVVSIAAGSLYSLALKSDGTVWAWGQNLYGQLGNGTNTDSLFPIQVPNLTNIDSVSAGDAHSLALKSDGTVWAWGGNSYGQLGDGTTNDSFTPIQVPSLSNIDSVSAGDAHSLALKYDGTVWAWGQNDYGQTGDGTITNRSTPAQVLSLADILLICAGSKHTLAVKADGSVWAWGSNSSGQLGKNSSITQLSPVQFMGQAAVSSSSAGGLHSVFLKTDGTVWTQGNNSSGQLGNGTFSGRSYPATQISGLVDVMEVGAGEFHTVALKTDGTVWAWGQNLYGQLGDGSTTDRSFPVQVSGLTNIVSISVGDNYALAVKNDGTVWAWGRNDYGQLGDGTTIDSILPIQVLGLSGIDSVSAGSHHSFAIKSDGTTWAWGANYHGEFGNGNIYTEPSTPIQISALSNVVSVVAGHGHTLALKSDGTVWACGLNHRGQLGTTSTPSFLAQVSGLLGVTAISAGDDYSLALKTDGTIWVWGDNGSGELGDGTTIQRNSPVQIPDLTNITSIAAGFDHTVSVKSDGTSWGWGFNDDGQVGTYFDWSPSQAPIDIISTATKFVSTGTDISVNIMISVQVDFASVTSTGDVTAVSLPEIVPPAANFRFVPETGYAISTTAGYNGPVTICLGYEEGNLLNISNETSLKILQYNNTSWDDITISVDELANQVCGETSSFSNFVVAEPFGPFNVTATAITTGGSISPNGTLSAPGSISQVFTITPDNGYLIDDVSGCGGILSNNLFTTAPLSADCSITAAFRPIGIDPDNMKISAGGDHVVALLADGSVWAWGRNEFGQLGDGTTIDRTTPVQVLGLADVISIAAGDSYSLAVKSDGTVWAWGINDFGQLGIGVSMNRSSPVQVSTLTGVMSVAAGDNHSLALKPDGSVWAWGYNTYGQLGTGNTTNRNTPVQVSGLTDAVAITAGSNHSFALKSDGYISAWGDNRSGQLSLTSAIGYRDLPTTLFDLINVASIAAGENHSLAIKSDGTVWTWGGNNYGQLGTGTTTSRSWPQSIFGISDIVYVAAGNNHSLAIKSDGTVWAWGRNDSGQLGDGSTSNRISPVQVSGLTDVVNVDGSSNFSVAIQSDGTVWGWGENIYGQLGDGSNTAYLTPSQALMKLMPTYVPEGTIVDVSPLASVQVSFSTVLQAGAISAVSFVQEGLSPAPGFQFVSDTANIVSSNAVYSGPVTICLDYNEANLVDFSNEPDLKLLQYDNDAWVDITTAVDAVSNQVCGETSSLSSFIIAEPFGPFNMTATAITPGGSINPSGSVSVTANTSESISVIPDPGYWVSSVSGCGGTIDNNLFTTELITADCNITVSFSQIESYKPDIASGSNHSLVVRHDGTVWTWGSNSYGQLGDSSNIDRSIPFLISGLTDFVSVAAGNTSSIAVKADGTAWAWGGNSSGQLGDGTTANRLTPIQVSNMTDVVSVAIKSSHSIALKNDGTVWAWGWNGSGQLGDGTTVTRHTPVQVLGLTEVVAIATGLQHSLALKADGTVWAWGENSAGQLGIGIGQDRSSPVKVAYLSNVISIMAGNSHSLALKADGTVWSWGANNSRQLGHGNSAIGYIAAPAMDLAEVISVAANGYYSLAVRADGTVWLWGDKAVELSDGSTRYLTNLDQVPGLIDVKAIADSSLIVKNDGSVWGWGTNSSGQLGDGTTIDSLIPTQALINLISNYVWSGTDVNIYPTPSVQVNFSSVAIEGELTAVVFADESSPTANYKIVPGTVYDISTTAEFSGPVTICLDYNENNLLEFSNESALKLFHFNGITWDDITTLVDEVGNKICGVSSTLSPFAIAEPFGPFSITATASNAGGSISPSGTFSADAYSTQVFTVISDPGYEVDMVLGCGGSLNGNNFTTAPISADCSVSAIFTLEGTAGKPVLLENVKNTYTTIQTAYDSIPSGQVDIIKIKAGEHNSGSLYLDRDVTIGLQGGYDDSFTNIISDSFFYGTLTISGDPVTVSDLTIK